MTETYYKHPEDCPDCSARHMRDMETHISVLRITQPWYRGTQQHIREAELALERFKEKF